jgi:hypothetical protein
MAGSMDFLTSAIGAIPEAASHPFALLAYLAVLLAWVVVAFRVKRNSNLLEGIHHLPERDRLDALKAEMGHVDVPDGLTATDWLKRNRQQYYFIAFLALLFAAVVVLVIAMVQVSNVERSNAELIRLLDRREVALQSAFDELLAPTYPEGEELEVPIFSDQDEPLELDIAFRVQLESIRAETNALLQQRRAALKDGELILAHELGNGLNKIGEKVAALISRSTDRVKQLEEMVEMYSTMCPECMWQATVMEQAERSRLASLGELHAAYMATVEN